MGWSYLFFWYFSGVHQLLLQFSDATPSYGLRQAFIVSTLWLIPALLMPGRGRQITALLGVVLWLFSLVSLGYYCIYRQEFSQSVIFIMFESNPAEASEYFAQYFAWWMVPGLLVYSAGAFFLWRRIRPLHMSRKVAWSLVALILLAVFAYPQLKLYQRKQLTLPQAAEILVRRLEPAVPWQIVFGYSQYRMQLAAMQDLLERNSQIPPLQNLRDANAGLPATLVLVIGESTSRQHMSLYGYARQTSPRLESMRDKLDFFYAGGIAASLHH